MVRMNSHVQAMRGLSMANGAHVEVDSSRACTMTEAPRDLRTATQRCAY
jgi:hypothetical protein